MYIASLGGRIAGIEDQWPVAVMGKAIGKSLLKGIGVKTKTLNVSRAASAAAGVLATILCMLAAPLAALAMAAPVAPAGVTAAMTEADKMTGDLLKFDPRLMPAEKGEAWIVGELTPGEKSGGAWDPPSVLDEKGVSHPGVGPTVVRLFGTCRVIAVLVGQSDTQVIQYAWQEPAFQGHFRPGQEPWLNRPRRGVAIMKVNWQIKDKNPFLTIFSIPAEWGNQVRDAVAYVKDHPELLDEKAQDEKAAAVKDKLNDPNPWLRVWAARTLAARGLFTADMAKPKPDMIWQEQAMYYILLAQNGPDGERQKAGKTYEAIIGAARTADEVKGIAVGAFRLAAQFPGNEAANAMAKQTLEAIHKRNALQEGDSPSAAYLRDMLKVEAIQQLYDERRAAEAKKAADSTAPSGT